MRIDREPVTWFLERMYCECGGEVKATGIVHMTYPPKYPHKCEKCDYGVSMADSYPRVQWAKV